MPTQRHHTSSAGLSSRTSTLVDSARPVLKQNSQLSPRKRRIGGMGRKKIVIKPIKDDRNRQVTLNKRRYGLMKKAYELSILCSCQIGLVIFDAQGHHYLYSSSDIGETIQRLIKAPNEPHESHTNDTMAKLINKRENRGDGDSQADGDDGSGIGDDTPSSMAGPDSISEKVPSTLSSKDVSSTTFSKPAPATGELQALRIDTNCSAPDPTTASPLVHLPSALDDQTLARLSSRPSQAQSQPQSQSQSQENQGRGASWVSKKGVNMRLNLASSSSATTAGSNAAQQPAPLESGLPPFNIKTGLTPSLTPGLSPLPVGSLNWTPGNLSSSGPAMARLNTSERLSLASFTHAHSPSGILSSPFAGDIHLSSMSMTPGTSSVLPNLNPTPNIYDQQRMVITNRFEVAKSSLPSHTGSDSSSDEPKDKNGGHGNTATGTSGSTDDDANAAQVLSSMSRRSSASSDEPASKRPKRSTRL